MFKWYVDGWDVRLLTYSDLRWLCKSLGLPHDGDTLTLRARLMEFKSFPSHFRTEITI